MASESTPQDSLSLEETNKVRISLGLKPIGAESEDGEPEEEDRDAIAERNFSERVREEKRQRAENEIKERIEKYVTPLQYTSADSPQTEEPARAACETERIDPRRCRQGRSRCEIVGEEAEEALREAGSRARGAAGEGDGRSGRGGI